MEKGRTGVYSATVIKKQIEALKANCNFDEGTYEAKIKQIVTCTNSIADLKKQIATAQVILLDHTKAKIASLDMHEITEFLELKWIVPITSAIKAMPDAILQQLADTVVALSDKYAVTYNEIESSIAESEKNLAELISQLSGDDFAIAGLSNLIKK